MTTRAHRTTVRHRIVVEAPIGRAFRVFTEGFDRFKPRDRHDRGADALGRREIVLAAPRSRRCA